MCHNSQSKNGDEEKTENGMIQEKKKEHKLEIVWFNVVWYLVLHFLALHGLFLWFTGESKWQTILFCLVLSQYCGHGITTGAHRLWTHKTYKAKLPLTLLLAFANTISLQNSIYIWARDHRVHHKYTDTDSDPHNSTRGFFFSHIGWLLVKKHADVKTKGKLVDLSDLKADPVVMFQHKYYIPLALFFGVFIPIWLPTYLWCESLKNSLCTNVLRYVVQLHVTWSINSVAHVFGNKPYNQSISAVQNKWLAYVCLGEGWHNYHHVFPWDYKTNEFGYDAFNQSAGVIDLMAMLGLAYDLKTTNPEIIRKRCLRTGDGSRKFECEDVDHKDLEVTSEAIWGWDDKEMKAVDRQFVEIHNRI